jgi:L-rhamnose mutarotase
VRAHAFTLMLRDDPGAVATYRAHHAAIWPEVIAALESVGIRKVQIFVRDLRMVMLVCVADGVEASDAFARLRTIPRYREWDGLMATLQARAPEARAGEWWAELESVFEWGADD